MADKPTYEELALRVKALEKEKEQWLAYKIESKENLELQVPEVDLGDIINTEELQSIMDDFCCLTNMVTAILDLKGKVIESTGWQELCTKFHRINPTTAHHCTTSDLFLAKHLKPGEYAEYKCQNGLWDVVTPLYVGAKHMGNIYTGQFFYDDEEIDEGFFIKQAETYGFDKKSYIEAFWRIPKYSRETIKHLMSFLVKFTTYISRISLLNIQLEKEIRERMQVEEALKKSKEYAEKLIESANAMIVVLDSDGRIRVINKVAEEITGYTRQELINKSWFEVLVPRDKYPNVWNAFLKSADEGFPNTFENPILTKAGDERFISWQNTVLSEDGVFMGSISYGIDITESKRMEKQLLQSQKMEAVGQLTGGIAHDFNNMLSVILGHVELLKSGLPSGDPLLRSVLEIENAGHHSRDITRQLLAFSRRQIITPKPSNLNILIANIQRTLTKLIGESIDLQFHPENDLWNVKIDPTQVDQIIFNLAANARDAMPDGGVLTIETSNIDLDEVYCVSNVECRPGSYVLLIVADNGVGMEKEVVSHIFEPFYTTKELGKGTGLGLATVYGIVKQNGGFMTVYSEPGKGTAFKIHFPRLIDEVEFKEAIVEETPVQFKPATILLVEDDEMVRRITAELLKKIGYSVLITESPHEALKFISPEDTSIDLMITDVIMPQMSGAELVAKIRTIKPDLKVLFMSGYTEDVIVRQGVLEEGIHFIHKPFSVNDFSRKIREAIEDNSISHTR